MIWDHSTHWDFSHLLSPFQFVSQQSRKRDKSRPQSAGGFGLLPPPPGGKIAPPPSYTSSNDNDDDDDDDDDDEESDTGRDTLMLVPFWDSVWLSEDRTRIRFKNVSTMKWSS